MKEIMFEFATFLLATVQAATLMWIMAVFVPEGKKAEHWQNHQRMRKSKIMVVKISGTMYNVTSHEFFLSFGG